MFVSCSQAPLSFALRTFSTAKRFSSKLFVVFKKKKCKTFVPQENVMVERVNERVKFKLKNSNEVKKITRQQMNHL